MTGEIIENMLDFTNIVKTSLDLIILKDCYIEENFRNYLTIPSINIGIADKAMIYLKKFKDKGDYKNIKEKDLDELINIDISKKKYSSILSNLIDYYDDN